MRKREIEERKIEDPFQYPIQARGYIFSGRDARSVRDGRIEGRERRPAATGTDTSEPQLRCGRCGNKVAPRSLRAGSVLCPRCRPDSAVVVVIHRGSEAPTTAEERRRLQVQADADRAAALAYTSPPPKTREHLIEIAWKNGALAITAERIMYDRARDGRPVTEDEALELAKDVIAEFGDTSPAPFEKNGYVLPHYPHRYAASAPTGAAMEGERQGKDVPTRWTQGQQAMVAGRYPRGRRVRTGGTIPDAFGESEPLPVPDPWGGAPPSRRDAAIARGAKERVARLKAARRARRALAELEAKGAGNTARQREAHVLVRVQGLRQADAARRMDIHRQTLADLLAKYDKATGSTT